MTAHKIYRLSIVILWVYVFVDSLIEPSGNRIDYEIIAKVSLRDWSIQLAPIFLCIEVFRAYFEMIAEYKNFKKKLLEDLISE